VIESLMGVALWWKKISFGARLLCMSGVIILNFIVIRSTVIDFLNQWYAWVSAGAPILLNVFVGMWNFFGMTDNILFVVSVFLVVYVNKFLLNLCDSLR